MQNLSNQGRFNGLFIVNINYIIITKIITGHQDLIYPLLSIEKLKKELPLE